jgi:hypothetical protein
MADLNDILARLERLEAERDILSTLHRYGHSIDYGREADWVDCFTEDGVFDTQYATKPGEPGFGSARFEGRAALAAFAAQHPRAPAALHKHLVQSPLFEIRGGEAEVTSYFELLLARDGARQIFAFGRYLDKLVRCPDGRWRFKLRTAEIQSCGEVFP